MTCSSPPPLCERTPTRGCRAGSVPTATWQTSKRARDSPDRLFLAGLLRRACSVDRAGCVHCTTVTAVPPGVLFHGGPQRPAVDVGPQGVHKDELCVSG